MRSVCFGIWAAVIVFTAVNLFFFCSINCIWDMDIRYGNLSNVIPRYLRLCFRCRLLSALYADWRHVFFHCMVVKGIQKNTGLVWVDLYIVACTPFTDPVNLLLCWYHCSFPASSTAVDKNIVSKTERSYSLCCNQLNFEDWGFSNMKCEISLDCTQP